MRSQIVLACSLAVGFFACDSSTGPSASNEPAQAKMLVEKNWLPVSDVFEPGYVISGVLITDNLPLRKECDHDGTISFSKDGTYISDEGPTTCLSDDPQTVTGTWTISSDGKKLTMIETGGLTTLYDVEDITDSSLKISFSPTFGDGMTRKQIFGFSALKSVIK